ncbi:MAG: DUF4230 domain-containing protein [Ignavibacteria bacterium]|nr:DUF4230 domain-containing protein [Ignavibacteria bacterium]
MFNQQKFLIVLLFCLLVTYFIAGCSSDIDKSAFTVEITEICELATVNYHYERITQDTNYTFDRNRILPNFFNPINPKSLLFIVMKGDIKLGIDKKKAESNGSMVSIDELTKTITITMPPIEILSHTRAKTEFFDTKLIPLSTENGNYYEEKIDSIRKKIEKEVKSNDSLIAAARYITEKYIKKDLEKTPGIKGKYTITFK